MLPEELLIYINTFICKREFNIENDIIEALNISFKNTHIPKTCNILEYKGKRLCDQHDNKALYNCFEVLSRIKERKPSTIHFETKESCILAQPYISNFGTISHYCCDGKGITFKKPAINNAFIPSIYTL